MTKPISQDQLDQALAVLAKMADGKATTNDLYDVASYEALSFLSRQGVANFRITRMVAGNLRFRWTMSPRIMPKGKERLEELGIK